MPRAPRTDRRRASRKSVSIFFNKYLQGVPHLAEALEISETGLVARRIHEPSGPRAVVAVELPGDEGSVWLCATPVWQNDELEALSFVGASEKDRTRIQALLAANA